MFRLLRILLITFAGLPLSVPAQAPAPQSTPASVLQELDRDIWTPFSKAFLEGQPSDYAVLHSDQLVRAMGDTKRIDNHAGLVKGANGMFKAFSDRGIKPRIQFRFLERFASGDAASERGIYEFSTINAEGKTRKDYGKFHVISRKESGKWKILVDYDSSEGKTINEASFNAAFALDDHAKY